MNTVQKHTAHSTAAAPTQRAFQEGVRSGQKFGAIAAPYILLAIALFATWFTWRILRTVWRWTR